MSGLRLCAGAAAAVALAGCAVGPRYVSPEPGAPAQGRFVGGATPAVSPAPPPGDWWRLYRDPALDGLVADALKANTDLRQAAAHLAEARAALRETRASLTPQTTVSASATRSRGSTATQGLGARLPDVTSVDAGLDVSYELDLFGRLRRAVQASRADLGATQAAYDLARITVAADTTGAYADACAYGQQLDVARRALQLQQQSYDMTQGLLKAGSGTALDVARAGALLDQTRAQIPQLEALRKGALYRLAVLTGRPPAQVSPAAAACRAPPVLTQPIPVGDGAALLARRPDVRQAERALAADTARVGVATADLYPTVTLGGAVGSSANSVAGLGRANAFHFSAGPLIQWTFPNILAAKARIAQARAVAAADLAAFDGTWLTALQETETALAAYAGQLDRVSALTGARDQAATASRLAHARFRSGLVSFIDVLDADRTLADADTALAQGQAQLSADQIALFLALGGGWQTGGAQASTG